MTVRAVEGKKPYTGGIAIEVTEDKVINLRLRDENNLIIWDEGDNEIYVDLQLPDGIKPTDAFPVGITTGRVLVADDWDVTGTIICAKTTSGDNIKVLYGDDNKLYVDNGTGLFKEVAFKSDVDLAIQTLRAYVDQQLALKQDKLTAGQNITIDQNNVISAMLSASSRFLSLWDCETGLPISFPGTLPFEYETGDHFLVENVDTTTNYRPDGIEYDGTASTTVETEDVAIGDMYYFDGTSWLLQQNHDPEVSFSQIAGQPTDNTNLATALSGKQDSLTLPNSPTQGNLVTWGADNETLVDGGAVPTVPTNISAFNNDSGYITGISSSDVTTALGYTPYDSSNPSGYTSNTGDVVGPSSSTDGHLAVFDGVTGKLIKDGGAVPTVPTNVSDFNNDAGYITGISSSDVTTALGYTPQASLTAGAGIDITSNIIMADDVVINMPSIGDDLRTSGLVSALTQGVTINNNGVFYKVWKVIDNIPTDFTVYASNGDDNSGSTTGYIIVGDVSNGVTSITAYSNKYIPSGGSNGDVLTNVSGTPTWASPSGGDVVGPSSSTDGHLALFDGVTGKLIKDGGTVPTGVPSGGNNGDVLTNVSGTPTWSAPSGGDVMVSTQTGNQFTPGMKIWGGSTSDFSSLTQDLNTLYMAY